MGKMLEYYIQKKFSIMEEWKKVAMNDSYEISNYGRLRRKKTDGDYFYLKCSPQTTSGYRFANIIDTKTKKRKHTYIHNLVLTAFKGERPEQTETSGKYVCDHFNRDKIDNRVENLRWVTETENLRNTHLFHSDIAETDPKKRTRILAKKRRDNPDAVKKRRKPGQGYIKQIGENKYWVICRIDGKKYKKTVNGTYNDAEDYAKFMNRFYRKDKK